MTDPKHIHTIMQPIVNGLMAVGVVERKLLEGKEKHAYFLWGHIKAKCAVGDQLELKLDTHWPETTYH